MFPICDTLSNKVRRMKKKALQAAIPYTIPVMVGYVILGMAYGFLMNEQGYNYVWSFFSSLIFFAGSAQYASIGLLAAGVHPIYTFMVIFLVNARHIFYGIGMLDRYKNTGKKKWYLIFALTDETFSVLSVIQPPKDVDKGWFYFFVSLLNQSYWVIGSVLGGLLGKVIHINSEGLEFVLTALFVVLMLEQWNKTKEHKPVLVGLGATIIALLVVGPDQFLLLAMAMIIGLLLILRPNMRTEVLE